jgi:hypothetical protein
MKNTDYKINMYDWDGDFSVKYKSAYIDFGSVYYQGRDSGNNSATLYCLTSEDKKKGHASKIMDYVCEIADMFNIELDLVAGDEKNNTYHYTDEQRNDMLSREELIEFYKRKGFVFKDGQPKGIRTPVLKDIDCEGCIIQCFEKQEEKFLEWEKNNY